MKEGNLAILLTPPGSAAIATVRLVGPKVEEFLRKHFSTVVDPHRAVHGTLADDGRIVDDPVIVLHEDAWTADINLHGGAWVVQSMLHLAGACGFEAVERLDLPLIDAAVDADDEIEREILTHLPLARTELAIRVLLNQRAAWTRLSDYSANDLQAVLKDRCLHYLLHPPAVAIIGAPNVGKSTIANHLFAQERSIVADMPGTTRDWVGEIANLDGLAVMLVDTPGQRSTSDTIEAQAIQQSRSKITSADLVVLILDPTQPRAIQQSLIEAHPDAMLVLNKVDQSPQWDVAGLRAIKTVATRDQGMDELRQAIRRHFDCDAIDPYQLRCWTDRQREQILRLVASD